MKYKLKLKLKLMVSLLSLIVVVYNLKRGFDDYGIRVGQIESCVFDSFYFNIVDMVPILLMWYHYC